MKVIHQLITYFQQREKLSARHLRQFTEKGFWGQYKSNDLRSLEKKIGQTFCFQVMGSTQGPLWGTDIYTSDSSLGVACVHAGLLQPGEEGTVQVEIVQPIALFQGSSRNGVVSNTWTTGWSGAFKVSAAIASEV